MYIYTHKHIHVYTHICIYTHTYTYMHTHIYVYMYICIYMYTHTHIHTCIHTHTHELVRIGKFAWIVSRQVAGWLGRALGEGKGDLLFTFHPFLQWGFGTIFGYYSLQKLKYNESKRH